MHTEAPEMHPQRFSLPEKNITSSDRLPVPELLSERLASLGWPLELQGTGQTDYLNREFSMHYPRGDVFFSFATIIHEMGHWRQGDIDSKLHSRTAFLKAEDIHDIVQNEKDAYERGMERVKTYAPDLLDALEKKFQTYKTQGKLKEISSFADLYEWTKMVSLTISEALESVKDSSEIDVDELQYQALKKAGVETLFTRFSELNVGETIDAVEVEKLLNIMAVKIALE